MNLVVRNMFDEPIQKFDEFRSEFDSFNGRWERRLVDSESSQQQRDSTVDKRLAF